jgi:SAM-dependent methyltransferase
MSTPDSQSPVQWRNFPGVYNRLAPPLRPAPSDVDRMRAAIASNDDETLLLGVTPGIASLGQELTAVEGSRAMIDRLWPGDGPDRRALVGDWTHLPFEAGRFGSVIGDGALNSVASGLDSLVGEISRVLRPGGVAAQRVFASPDDRESLDKVHGDALASRIGNVHALKWRIAMAIAEAPDYLVPVADILAAFNAMFPDRPKLASITGWDAEEIDTLDAYVGAWHSLCFPTRGALRDLGAARFAAFNTVESDGYPLAERCPLIVWSR